MSGNDTIEFIRRGIQRAPLVTLSLTVTLLSFWIVVQTDPEASTLTQQVIERWGNSYLKVAEGELWRLFTYAFIHATPSHLVFNLIGILILGTRVERLIGHIGLMSLFLGATSLGGILSFLWRDYELSIGASGALYGLLGAELIFMRGLKRASGVLMERRLNLGFMLSALWLVMGLFLGVLNELNSETSAVDNATHFASFFSGALLGWALLWARSYRVHQDSLRGVISALSPLLMSVIFIGACALGRPTPPGFGGLLHQLRSQELTWRLQQRALSRLSPAEQREVWAERITPPLTEMTLALDELIERKLAKQAPSHQLAYARDLSRYLNLWLEGARALSQEPLDLLAPPLAQLRASFDQSRGRGALLLAEAYRVQLVGRDVSRSELKPITIRRAGRQVRTGDERMLSALFAGDGPLSRPEELERLGLLDWVALISIIQPQLEVERQLAVTSLSACLLSRLVREGDRSERSLTALQIPSAQPQISADWEGCQRAEPDHVMYGSLLLVELTAQSNATDKLRWLRFTLSLLTRVMSTLAPSVEDRGPPPTRLELADTLQMALNHRQLYTLWSQLAAQTLYDLLSEGVAEPLSQLSERWWLLAMSGVMNTQRALPSPPAPYLSWVEPISLTEGKSLKIKDLAPGPEGILMGVYRMESGQHWLVEVPLPARLTTQTLLIPATCDVACATVRPALSISSQQSSSDGESAGQLNRVKSGHWIALYHLSNPRQSSLPMLMTSKVTREEEERFGWRAWPIGVSDL